MHATQLLSLAVAAAVALAQTNTNGSSTSLTAALASQPDLSNMIALLSTQPTFMAQLSLAQNVTFLAPSNNALNDFLNGPNATPLNRTTPLGVAALLSYHVLNGTFYDSEINDDTRVVNTALNLAPYSNITGGQRISFRRQDGNATFFSGLMEMSSVTTPNINYTGGVIHVINRVLTLPVNDTRTLTDLNLTAAAGAIRRADLSTRLDRLRDVTMFIPNNEAFDRVGSSFEDSKMSADQLSQVLQYHIVQGSRPFYTSALANSSLTTLNGARLTFTNTSNGVFVNSAKIVSSNVLTNNGVIHVIDNVLNPNNVDARPDPSATSGSPMFSGASPATGVPFTSGVSPAPGATPTGADGSNGGNGGNGGGNGNGQGSEPARGAAAPMQTGIIGAAALFGGAAILANL
ncbi:hypothetical protein PpBr36_07933 [Pyricularia pennisetigena]|uniref:hypothetical protein n=1 Tax=Pyricularia pennisetigena TaxID=1578925 RepID=UPI00114D6C03|nr:hypothetical protein PpBr36_07933 [Pyricularia pennisetigena]TLS25150.1 hypothetical protein PpBr36_07933 [Pyricularia pennisetigena]